MGAFAGDFMSLEGNIQQVLQALATGRTKASWSKSIDDLIKLLKRKRKLEDRLNYAELLAEILSAMTHSIKGWQQWTTNVHSLSNLTEEEYKKFVPKLLEIAIKWLEIDRDLTAKKEKEIQKAVKPKKTKEKSPKYVS